MNLLVVKFKEKIFQFKLSQNVILVGGVDGCDIKIESFPILISLVIDSKTFKIIPHGSGKLYKNFSAWNEYLPIGSIWGNELVEILIPENQNDSYPTLNNWEFNNLPKNLHSPNYLQNVLNFICDSLQINELALFKRTHGNLSMLSAKNIKIEIKTSELLNNLLEENEGKTYFEVKNQLHSIIFQASDNLNDFILIKNKISLNTEIVLYLPIPQKLEINYQKELLKTLLYLFSHSISLHLAYQKNSRILKDIEEEDLFYWGKNLEMQRNKKIIDRVLKTDLSLLILGDTGTGKEMIARYVAQKTGKKIITVNCSTIPKDLAESFLFGHKKGSFTGAISDQIGKIKEASEGILFLDEIGELSKDIQAKLLRALQETQITPVGGREEKIQFRLISATHRNLNDMINNELFREDLFYRINELTINIPNLKNRREDLLDLSNYILINIFSDLNLAPIPLSLNAQEFILCHEWPGNVRELKSSLKKAVILNDKDQLELNVSNKLVNKKNIVFNFEEAKNNFIKKHLEDALKQTNNNRTEAAKLLGIPVRSMFRLISTYLHDENVIGEHLSH